ncbi:hypothetical protein ACTXT7_000907 [Hymenolepis weldensis]
MAILKGNLKDQGLQQLVSSHALQNKARSTYHYPEYSRSLRYELETVEALCHEEHRGSTRLDLIKIESKLTI